MGWLSRLLNHFRPHLDREIDEELDFHLAARTRELVAGGRLPEDARREALRRLGNRLSTRERVRDSNLLMELERVAQDLRNGVRTCLRDRGLSAIAILSIAIGTGANVAIFSVSDVLLLRPQPIARPDEVQAIGSKLRTPGGGEDILVSYPDYLDLRERTTALSGLMASRYEFAGFSKSGSDPARIRIASFVTDNYFDVLGLNMALGRAFSQTEAGRSNPQPVVILSHAMWRTEFQADPHVVGTVMRVAGRPFTIVGVAPEAFTGLHPLLREAFFLPLGLLPRIVDVAPDLLDARNARMFNVKGRLRPGESLRHVQVQLDTIGEDLQRRYPDPNPDRAIVAESDFKFRFGLSRIIASMLVLTTILSLAVLCVACANVASLLAGRAPARAREMALRLAVGASRPRLIRQLMIESLTLAALGGIAGLVVARVGIGLLRGIQIPSDIIAAPSLRLDERALAFAIAVAVLTAFIAGLVPALQATRVDLNTTLKAGDRGSASPTSRGRVALVAVQLALSVVLVTVSAVTFRFFQSEVTAGPGFRTSKLAKLTFDAGQARYAARDAGRFFEHLLERVRALPAVESASVASAMPMASYSIAEVVSDDRETTNQNRVRARSNSVDARYFDTMAIRLLNGRRFGSTDAAGSPQVAIVNDTLARRYWPGRDAVGRRLRVLENPATVVEVVGVVVTTTYYFLGEAPEDAIYFPYEQRPRGQMVLLATTRGESAALIEPIRQIGVDLDRNVPVFDADTVEHWYEVGATGTLLAVVRLIAALGVMGLMLSSVGLYGLVAYAVSRRTREFGIRLALGATAARIVTMVLRQGTPPVWFGMTTGLALSVVAARWLLAFVPVRVHVGAGLFFVVIPLLIGVTFLAAIVPARRAGCVNPIVALRDE